MAIGVTLAFAPEWFRSLPPVNGPALLIFLYVVIAIHEAGHLIAGKLIGMDPGGVLIGGFHFLRSGDRWTFHFEPRLIFGGFAKLLAGKRDLRPRQVAWMVAGGPIASVLLTVFCASALMVWGPGESDWISSFLWASAISCLSLIPMSRGLVKSDGARLWQLLMRPDEADSWLALVALETENTLGVRPRDWEPALVDRALSPRPDGPESAYREILAFYRSVDCGDEPGAIAHLEKALEHSGRGGKALRHVCFLEAAAESAKLGRAEAARTWFQRARRVQRPKSSHGVQGLIAKAEGRYEDALREFGAAREFLERRKLDSGLARLAKELLASWETECRAAVSATRSAAMK